MPYLARRPAQHEDRLLRSLRFRLYRWQGSDSRPVVLLHGWGDSAATWQFLVDELAASRTLIGFDLRGFGCTQHPEDGYWFADYLADLDALLDTLEPAAPVDLVGHSMGGNIAMLYAGVRPQRVRSVVSLEAFGLPPTAPDQAPARYAQWLDEVKHGTRYAVYDSYEQLMQVLARRNPRITAERLEFIARCWAQERADGRIELRADPKHKRVNPVLYQREQAQACWRSIVAPLLLVVGTASELAAQLGIELSSQRLAELFRHPVLETVPGAGHMLHHEQPAETAAIIERFLNEHARP